MGIVGCGIAGQASAIALARAGHAVTVVERFSEARPVGAGLLVQPSGQAALAALGLLGGARAWGEPISALSGHTAGGRMVMDLRYGELGDGTHGLGIHRAALFAILHEALRQAGAVIRLGFEVREIVPSPRPILIAADGARIGPFDLVLDCAGAHDTLRTGRAPLYPWGALWTTCRDEDGRFGGLLRQRYRGARTMIGILPVGRMPGAPDDARHVAFFWSEKLAGLEATRAAGMSAWRQRVREIWPESAPVVDQIEDFDRLSLATYRDVRVRPWHRGRVLALGDAAHGTSPQLGQGANLALIDALVLAQVLAETNDVERAFARYERLRRPHVRFYQLASRLLTPFFQSESRVLGLMRDAALGPVGQWPIVKQVMQTTLAGVRLFPYGVLNLPDLSVEMQPAAQRDRGDVSRIAEQQ